MRDLAGTVILLGVLQGVVLAPVLWARRANRLGNRILATLVFVVALLLLLVDLEHRFGFAGHPHLLGLGAPLPFLLGPLLYLYAIALTRPVVRFDPRWLVHALPFVADALFMAQVFYLKGGDEKIAIARATNAGHVPISLNVVTAFEIVQAFVYLLLTWKALERYGKKMQGYFSDLARIDLRWLRTLVLAHVAVWCVVLLTNMLRWIANVGSSLGAVVHLGSTFVIFLTGYVSLWQAELVQKATAANVADEAEERAEAKPEEAVAPSKEPEPPQPAPPEVVEPERSPPPKYQRNRLDDAEAQELATKLQRLMAEKKLYRDSGLTLPTLADELSVPPHTLSQVLNVRIGKSFFVFVNSHRAEALKEVLARPESAERGVLELAFEVGFNSKSTLNSFFKRHTGMTPTEFRGRAQSKTQEKSGS